MSHILSFLILHIPSNGQVPINKVEDVLITSAKLVSEIGDLETMSEDCCVIVRVHVLRDSTTTMYFHYYNRYRDSSGIFVMDMIFNNFRKLYRNIELTPTVDSPVISVFWGAPSGKIEIEEATCNDARTEWKLKAPSLSSPVGLRATVRSMQPVTVDIYQARGINVWAD